MKLIKPKYEILQSQGLFKDIEIAARTCYMSHDKIMEGSAEKIVKNLIERGHGAMLEHGTVYLKYYLINSLSDCVVDLTCKFLNKYAKNKYSRVSKGPDGSDGFTCITTNYRVLIENNWLEDLEYQCEPTEYHEKRISVRFNCDIGVSREFNRHRVNSIAEQSTRYCNFSKEQFGNEITYIQPDWVSDEEFSRVNEYTSLIQIPKDKFGTLYEKETSTWSAIDWWIWSLACSELAYINLIKLGWQPQQARDCLPLSTKTELIHTAFISDWQHFFNLRDAKTAHPSARELATPLHKEFKNLGYLLENE